MTNLRTLIKRKLGQIYQLRNNHKKRKVIILYHSVGNTNLGMNKNKFINQLKWLKENCYIKNINDLLETNNYSAESSKPLDIEVAITFDDGYQSVIKNIYPIMQELNISGCIYLNTNFIFNNRNNKSSELNGHYHGEYFLSWKEIKELKKNGWEIGSHGCDHLDLTSISENLLKKELFNSKAKIEKYLGAECKHFSYPWGYHNKSVINMVQETGYKFAVSGIQKSFDQKKDSFFAIPRFNISNDYTLYDFQSIIKGYWDYLSWDLKKVLIKK
tara:strand:+ start:134 stop:949 length:816 start_codon:yes stop_codon:yes gene_type:complete